MKPGRELDALVAEKVMGWPVVPYGADAEFPHLTPIDEKSPLLLWREPDKDGLEWSPSTDIAAAWEVRDRVAQMVFARRRAFTEGCRRLIGDRLGADDIHHSEVILRVTPEDICFAALGAVGAL